MITYHQGFKFSKPDFWHSSQFPCIRLESHMFAGEPRNKTGDPAFGHKQLRQVSVPGGHGILNINRLQNIFSQWKLISETVSVHLDSEFDFYNCDYVFKKKCLDRIVPKFLTVESVSVLNFLICESDFYLSFFSPFLTCVSPWYNQHGGLCIKFQLSYSFQQQAGVRWTYPPSTLKL